MTRFDVTLRDAGDDVDAVYEYLLTIGHDAADAEALVENGGTVATGVSSDRADDIETAIEERGGDVGADAVEEATDGAGTTGETRPGGDGRAGEDPASNGAPDDGSTSDGRGVEDAGSSGGSDADTAGSADEPASVGADAVGDDVFQFMTVRPADSERADVITLTATDGDLLETLTNADAETTEGRAESYRDSEEYVPSLSVLRLPLGTLDDHLADDDTMEQVGDAVRSIFEREPADVVADVDLQSDRRRLAESLAASGVLPGIDPGEHEAQMRGLRLVDMIERAAAGGSGTVAAARRRSIALPEGIDRPRPVRGEPAEGSEGGDAPARVLDLVDDLVGVRSAQRNLSAVDVPSTVDEDDLGATDVAIETPQPGGGGGADGFLSGLLSFRRTATDDAADAAAATLRGRVPSVAQPDVEAGLVERSPWTLPTETVDSLSTDTRSVLSDVGLRVDRELPLPRATSSLERRETEIGTSLYSELFGNGSTTSVPVGDRLYPTAGTVLTDGLVDIAGTGALGTFDGVDHDGLLTPDDLPDLGAVRPLGVGEMRTVRQKIKRYEPGEVAHIENVLEGESKERTHRRATTTEETLITETETEQEESKDLQSTERFEMERETARTIQEESSTQAGVQVTASYGPSVEVEAYADFSRSSAREESQRAARAYSREVTERSVERMKKREFERTEEFSRRFVEETNVHELANDDPGNVSGVYRFVDKIYEARVLQSPEKRMLVEFIVPEPAAFYRKALAENPAENVRIEKPREPVYAEGLERVESSEEFEEFYGDLGESVRRLQPTDLTRSNYKYYAAQYGADVSPPPAKFSYVTETFSEKPEGPDPSYKDTTVEVDGGRVATKANVSVAELHSRSPGDQTDSASVKVYVGDKYVWGSTHHSYRRPYSGSLDLDDLTGDVPVLVSASQVHGWAASVSLLCERTDAAFEEWQLETYDATMAAYEERKARYRDALDAASTRGGIEIEGDNPATNRKVEREELKKHAIAMLRDRHVDVDAVEDDGRVDLAAADEIDDRVSFFEQAFEWPAMTYLFYPYYWSRREKWPALLSIEDTDPRFASFLKAGAARVVVPVRPGMTQDVLWYLQHGELWHGDGAPNVTDPRFVPIAQEMREHQSGPRGYEAVGEPWDVKVPTELISLQDGSTLPEFTPVEWPESTADD